MATVRQPAGSQVPRLPLVNRHLLVVCFCDEGVHRLVIPLRGIHTAEDVLSEIQQRAPPRNIKGQQIFLRNGTLVEVTPNQAATNRLTNNNAKAIREEIDGVYWGTEVFFDFRYHEVFHYIIG